jgi:hypothetical protein
VEELVFGEREREREIRGRLVELELAEVQRADLLGHICEPA